MSDPKQKATPEAASADEPQKRGRLVRNPLAITISDMIDLMESLQPAPRKVVLHMLNGLYAAEPQPQEV